MQAKSVSQLGKPLAQYGRRAFAFTYPCPRRLREIMKMSAIEKETPETIEQIWYEYHNAKPYAVSRVLSTALYMQLMNK
jgi:ATP11 protein